MAAFLLDLIEILRAPKHLEPHRVSLYIYYDEMIRHPGLDMMVAATRTVHEMSVKQSKRLKVTCTYFERSR